jgi:hypothetical protein
MFYYLVKSKIQPWSLNLFTNVTYVPEQLSRFMSLNLLSVSLEVQVLLTSAYLGMLATHPDGSNKSLFSLLSHQSSSTCQGELKPSGRHVYAKRRFGP